MNILIAPILSALCAVSGDTGSLVLQAEVVHGPDGPIEDGRILIRDGKIEAIGAGLELPEDGHLIELEGHLSAGLVAMGDQTGLKGEALDSTRQIMDGADLAFGYDKTDDGWGAFLEAGVTAVLLTPKPGALVGGRTAVVKPAGAMVQRRAHLHVCFSNAAFKSGVAPTSYPGAISMLEQRMETPTGGFALLGKGLGVLLAAKTRAEGLRAVAFAKRHGLTGALTGVSRAGDLADELHDAGLGVILPPIGAAADPRVAASAAILGKKDIPLAFSLGATNRSPHALRISALRCMKAGLARDAAWKALTSGAGEIANAPVGSLAVGRAADMVLWSGDPLDLTSQVERVWIEGKQVHGDDDQ
jgi:hypothetical protein